MNTLPGNSVGVIEQAEPDDSHGLVEKAATIVRHVSALLLHETRHSLHPCAPHIGHHRVCTHTHTLIYSLQLTVHGSIEDVIPNNILKYSYVLSDENSCYSMDKMENIYGTQLWLF